MASFNYPFCLIASLALLLPGGCAYAQADTVLQLEPVTVTASRLRGWQPGLSEGMVDSMQLSLLRTQTVSEALRQQSGLYVRDYGAGNIATASARGASAGHTAVLWNGIPIQDPMLGLTDLSILPLFLFDEIRFIPGGSSALWGSGAVGGVVHLDGLPPANNGWNIRYQGEAGSFGQLANGLAANLRNTAFSNTTRLFHRTADNNYPYRDIFSREKRLPNAETRQWSLMQENTFQLTKRQQLGGHFWWQASERGIPPTRVQQSSRARQEDESLRAALDWQWKGDRSSYMARLATSQAHLIYEDSLTNTFSDSRTSSLLGEIESTHVLKPQWHLKLGLHYNRLGARSNVYETDPRQNRLAAFTALRWWSKNEHWQAVLNGRQEWVDGAAVPFTPSLSLRGQLNPRMAIGASISRNYRLPTFNDLYWPEGGNPDLLPESGWNQSLFLRAEKQGANWSAYLQLSGFNFNINNWIAWLPQGAYWAPENVRQVWSRGGEAQAKLSYKSAIGLWSLHSQYSYTRSTNEKSLLANDATLQQQLLYVPLHQGRVSLAWQFKGWYAAYYHEWTGKAYTLPDNSASLPGASVGALRASRSWQWKKISGLLYLHLENCWNTDYERVANRPMPGRSLRVGVQLAVGS